MRSQLLFTKLYLPVCNTLKFYITICCFLFSGLHAIASKIGVLLNPDNCILCNNGVNYLETINCDSFIVFFPEQYSENEANTFIQKSPAFKGKEISLVISNIKTKTIRNKCKLPDNTQSVLFVYGANDEIVKSYNFKELSGTTTKAINALIRNNIKVYEKRVEDERFTSLGYEEVCTVARDMICLSYPRNKIMIVDEDYNLKHILLPKYLPIQQIYTVYNNNDTTGFYHYNKRIQSLHQRGKTPLFQFNSIKPYTDSSYLVMGSLYVATKGMYQGQPSMRISQKLMLIEFMENKIISIHSLKTDKRSQIKRGFYPDYTNYTKSFDNKGIDVAIERDNNRGRKLFLAKLNSDDGQTSLDYAYRNQLPKRIKKDTTPYLMYTFYKVNKHIFFKYDFENVYTYNGKSKLSTSIISGLDETTKAMLKSDYTLECVSKQPFGYELLFVDDAFKTCKVLRLNNDLSYICMLNSDILRKSKSNVAYDYESSSYCFRSNDNVVIQLTLE